MPAIPAYAYETRALFRRTYEALPMALAHGPGRLEVLGSRADEHQGLALAAALENGAWVAVGHRNDGRVRMASSHFRDSVECFIDRMEPDPSVPWADYPKSILAEIIRRGANCTGFNLYVHSNLSIQRGFGSSGAVASATLLALRSLFSLKFPPQSKPVTVMEKEDGRNEIKTPERIELARICRDAAKGFPGLRGGMIEPLTSLCGKRGHLVLMDFLHESIHQLPMPVGCVLVATEVVDERDRAVIDEELIAQNAESSARILGVASLRRADPELVESRKNLLSGGELAIARHIASENRRVVAAERALVQGDSLRLGECLSLSHASQSELLKASTKALDMLVGVAKTIPGCVGAGTSGRDNGRVMLAVVQHEQAAEFIQILTEQAVLQARLKVSPRVMIPADGAVLEDA